MFRQKFKFNYVFNWLKNKLIPILWCANNVKEARAPKTKTYVQYDFLWLRFIGFGSACLAVSCLVLPCLVVSYVVLSCFVVSSRVLSCLVLSCLVLSCLALSCLVLSCLVLPCRVGRCGIKDTTCALSCTAPTVR